MLISKSFLVIGSTTTKDGKKHKDIAEKVDAAINSFLSTIDGKYIDLKPNVQLTNGIGEDIAFITVIVEVDGRKKEAVSSETNEEIKPVWSKKRKE